MQRKISSPGLLFPKEYRGRMVPQWGQKFCSVGMSEVQCGHRMEALARVALRRTIRRTTDCSPDGLTIPVITGRLQELTVFSLSHWCMH
jgi:hypothetical protein